MKKILYSLSVLFITTAANAQWVNVSTNSVKGLKCISILGNQGLIGGDNGTLIHSSDAGLNWNDSLYYPYDPVFTVGIATPTIAVASSNNKRYVSDNGGITFSGPYTVSNFNDFRDIAFRDASNAVAVSNFCEIANSTDGGQNWTANLSHPCGNSSELTDVDFPTSMVGYICGHNGYVFKTTDGGGTWLPVTAPGISSVNYVAIQFIDANTGFISGRTTNGGDTTLFKKTTDGGATWNSIISGVLAAGVIPSTPIPSFSFLNASTGYLVAYNKIYKTTDGGTTWALDFTNTVSSNAYFNKILTSASFSLAVGANGVAARLAGSGNGVNEIKDNVEITVYPNPSGKTITLGSFLVQNQNAFLEISDINGRIVRAEKLSTNEVDVTAFGNGIYFGKLINNTGANYTFKFVKE